MTEEDGKGGKMPRLTIMEEVLLLGLKDKQVCPTLFFFLPPFTSLRGTGGPSPQKFPCTTLLVRLLRPS